jgi:Ca2+-binding RTX toxin-like protein
MLGGAGNDLLTGGTGNDNLKGNSGSDRMDGMRGNDILTGGQGKDQFAFTTALNASTNVDQITDFKASADDIWIDNAVFTGLRTGKLGANAFRAGTAAPDADDRIIYDQTTGSLYFDRDGVGGAAMLKFAQLVPGTALTAHDILVI